MKIVNLDLYHYLLIVQFVSLSQEEYEKLIHLYQDLQKKSHRPLRMLDLLAIPSYIIRFIRSDILFSN